MSQATGISIVIRTSNSGKPLRTLLRHLKLGAQDEVIIVDTASTDGTISLAKEAAAKIIRNVEPFNYSHTLNLGFHAAQNNWVLALSVHCVPVNADFLDRYRSALVRLPETLAVVYGLQVFSKKGYERLSKEITIHSSIVPAGQWRGGGNTNALYFRPAWETHPFDETIPRGEDAEWRDWALGAGYICAEAPEACMFYRHNKGPLYRYKKAYDDVMTCMPDSEPMTFRQLAMSAASATRHLIWENFYFTAWIGEMAHTLGTFVATRQKNKR
jgi:glycosyltransferase involved in cell wall biosynthesis